MQALPTLANLDVSGKTVLVRVDLNVPVHHGKIEDVTRIARVIPTLEKLLKSNAKVVVLSHFGRPKGQPNVEMSLAPIVDALSEALDGKEVHFGVDCIGHAAEDAVASINPGEIILLENVRFHPGEEANDPDFAAALAKLGDFYVNDAFSCSHRAHASIVGLAERLPSAAGCLLQEEVENMERILSPAVLPMAAIVGGAKISTKLALLQSFVSTVNVLIIGGAMANTFLKAKGIPVGRSLVEDDLVPTAQMILKEAEIRGCKIVLPEDVVIAEQLAYRAPCQVVAADSVPATHMILDVGPESVASMIQALKDVRTLVWNGPLGAFETSPFDVGTISLARFVAARTAAGTLCSVTGGGDSVSALAAAGLPHAFSYVSTAGGAFLEWLEGKELPGITILRKPLGKRVCA